MFSVFFVAKIKSQPGQAFKKYSIRIHEVFRGLKFEYDAEIGQISADFERKFLQRSGGMMKGNE